MSTTSLDFECVHCQKMFKSTKALKMHSLVHRTTKTTGGEANDLDESIVSDVSSQSTVNAFDSG